MRACLLVDARQMADAVLDIEKDRPVPEVPGDQLRLKSPCSMYCERRYCSVAPHANRRIYESRDRRSCTRPPALPRWLVYRARLEAQRHVEQPDAAVDARAEERRKEDQPVAAVISQCPWYSARRVVARWYTTPHRAKRPYDRRL